MIRWTTLFALIFLRSVPSLSQDAAIDIVHYIFRIELNDTTDIIAGKATVKMLLKNSGKQVSLDLMSRLPGGKGMRVTQVSIDGQQVSFTHTDHKLTIQLKKGAAGEQLTIDIHYSGSPDDGLIISKNKFGDRTFFGDNWPDRAHHWVPVIDHPSDKASVEFVVTAPSHYEVIANGVKVEESDLGRGRKLTHWKEEVPISVKVMVIGAARFAVQYADEVENISVEHWVYPQNREAGFHDYAAASDILRFLIQRIGPYPFKKLANVQSKTKYGGMENASNIFYTESSVNGQANHDDLIAHEIAHQWFGNSATESDWHHIWLSEGFSTYLSNAYFEHAMGDKARQEKMAEDRKLVIDFAKTTSLPIVFTRLPQQLLEILSTNSYKKGSWVLHMLRQELGDDVFWNGMRSYYREYRNSNAKTEDFRRVMEKAAGKDLETFFQQWLYRPGHPALDFRWSYDGRGSIDIEITQSANGKAPIFDFPLEIGIWEDSAGTPRVERVRITGSKHRFSFKTAQKPQKIEPDPNVNLLFEAKTSN